MTEKRVSARVLKTAFGQRYASSVLAQLEDGKLLLQPIFMGLKLKTLLDTPVRNIAHIRLVGQLGVASFRIELRDSLKVFEFTPVWVEDWVAAFRNSGIPVEELATSSVLNKAKYYGPRFLLGAYLVWVLIAALQRLL
jgi:hypothetical protein